MTRFGMILRIKPGMKTGYLNAHKDVWPEVLTALKGAHIQNNTTFVNEALVVMYLEYTGTDFGADWQRYAQTPKVQEWFMMLKSFLEPYELPVPPTKWTVLEEAFHLD